MMHSKSWVRASRMLVVLPAVLLLCMVHPALAGPPSAPNSTCPSAVTVDASGSMCFDVVVRDFMNNPVSGSTVAVDFAGCSVTFCPSQAHTGDMVFETTNLSGVAHFCICASLASTCSANISADGVPLCTVPASGCDSTVPRIMSYQGVLTDGVGGIAPDGNYNFAFSIYDDSLLTSGHLLWSETHNNVPVERGGFNVLLGRPVPLALAFDKQYYLTFGVALAPDPPGPELAPRIPLTAAPYSMVARTVADCGVTGSSIAPGQVVRSLNGLTDDVTLVAGSNITITPSGQSLTIAATGGGGGLGGSGTANYVAKFTGASSLGNSALYESGGNVGIGTAAPSAPLDILKASGQAVARLRSNTNSGSLLSMQRFGSGNTFYVETGANSVDNFSIHRGPPYNDFVISSAGNIGIGTTVPGAPLHIQGTQAYERMVTTGNLNGSVLELWNTMPDGIDPPHPTYGAVNFGNGSTTPGQITCNAFGMSFRSQDANGVLTLTSVGAGVGRSPLANKLEVEGNASKTSAGSWLANSDARIKTGVTTIAGALDKLDQVRLVNFRYTDAYRASHPSIGDADYCNVIAQEFREVFPDHVKGSGERLPNGEEILQVDTYPLTIYSAAAIQELRRLLVAKDAEIARLRGELADQRESLSRTESRLGAIERALLGSADRSASAAGLAR